jgi:Rrf2 family protein
LGVFATIHLAEGGDGPLQCREIAENLGVSSDSLLKILQQLVKARILTSGRGPAGGFRLRMSPDRITLLGVVEAIEGSLDGEVIAATEIRDKRKAKAGMELACQEVAHFARALLGRTTIRDLMDHPGS